MIIIDGLIENFQNYHGSKINIELLSQIQKHLDATMILNILNTPKTQNDILKFYNDNK